MKHTTDTDGEYLFRDAEVYESRGQFAQALKCLLASAAHGNNASMLNVGNYYADGIGTRKNFNRASYWYKRAYRAGNMSGPFNLAVHFMQIGKTRSSVIWFKKAIAMGYGSAYLELAKLYLRQNRNSKAAADLLLKVMPMKPEFISDDEKQEAVDLLKVMSQDRKTKL